MPVSRKRAIWIGAGLVAAVAVGVGAWLSLAPRRVDMATVAPRECLLFVEVDSLPDVASGLTHSDAWRALAGPLGLSSQLDYTGPVADLLGRLELGPDDAVALGRAQIAVVVTGIEAGAAPDAEGATLVVKPRFAIAVKTRTRPATARALADARLPMLARRAYGENVEIAPSEYSGVTLSTARGPEPGRQMVWAVREDLIVVGNSEESVRGVLDAAAERAPSLAGDFYLARLRTAVAADGAVVFAYVSKAGVGRLVGVGPGIIAGSITSDPNRAASVSHLFADISEGAVQGLAYSGSFDSGRFVDRYYTMLAPPVADAAAVHVRPATGEVGALDLVPDGVAEVNFVHVERPGEAFDAMLTALSSRLDVGVSAALTQIAIEIRRAYGVEADQPVGPALGDEVMFVDPSDGGPLVAVFEARDTAALLPVVERYLTKDGARVSTDTYGGVDVLVSSDADGRAASFVGRYLVLGTRAQIARCVDARSSGSKSAAVLRESLGAATLLATERRDTSGSGDLLLAISRATRASDGSPELLERPDVKSALDGLPPAVSRLELRDGGIYSESRSAVGGLSYLTAFLPGDR